MNRSKRQQDLLDNASWEASKLHSLAWAANQLLLHNCDNTVDDLELQNRVSDLLDVIKERSLTLSDQLEKGGRHVHDQEEA